MAVSESRVMLVASLLNVVILIGSSPLVFVPKIVSLAGNGEQGTGNKIPWSVPDFFNCSPGFASDV